MADSGLTSTAATVLSSILQQASSAAPAHGRPTPPAQGGWSAPDSTLTKLFSGDPSTIALAFIVTLSLPVLLHLYFYTQSARSRSSGGSSDGVATFLLVGPIGSGKTSLVTLLQRRLIAATNTTGSEASEAKLDVVVDGNGEVAASPTRLSQVSSTVGMQLPPGIPLGSNKYRSENDYEVAASKKHTTPYKIIDTPGHGKLRLEQALSYISRPGLGLRGVIFVVDSAAIDPSAASDGGDAAQDTVRYLHDVLLNLQRRPKVIKKARGEDVRVLVACNKQDLFTALPPAAIKERLQTELEKVRTSKRRGVTAVDAREDVDENEDETVLGGGGEAVFTFKLLEDEFGVAVDVVGGAVKGDDGGKGVRKWEEWIGSCL